LNKEPRLKKEKKAATNERKKKFLQKRKAKSLSHQSGTLNLSWKGADVKGLCESVKKSFESSVSFPV